ncbi:class I SAM-dependent methyltransferase [Candidatus Neomarinimicrobiota bacterium]
MAGKIIKRYSSNTENIILKSLNGIRFQSKINLLDLGCGYGNLIPNLLTIIPEGSNCTGIDWLKNNRQPYLSKLKDAGYNGNFIQGPADHLKTLPKNHFDLIFANYSLYFFPELISNIAAALHTNGIFITITHSIHQLKEFLSDLGKCINPVKPVSWQELGSNQFHNKFCSENGKILLSSHFSKVELIKYNNNLIFDYNSRSKCKYYLNFKRPAITYGLPLNTAPVNRSIESRLNDIIQEKFIENGKYILNKNDMIFRCRL